MKPPAILFRQKCRLLMVRTCRSVFCHRLRNRLALTVILRHRLWMNAGFILVLLTCHKSTCGTRQDSTGRLHVEITVAVLLSSSFHHPDTLNSLYLPPPYLLK